MTRIAILFLFLAASLPAQTTPQATPRPYTTLYVFGDSYSDTGAGFPYADGPTAVAYLPHPDSRVRLRRHTVHAPWGKSFSTALSNVAKLRRSDSAGSSRRR
jgi:hypothetical protein